MFTNKTPKIIRFLSFLSPVWGSSQRFNVLVFQGKSYKKKEGDNMHMADALLHPAVAGTMYGATGAALVYSIATLKKDDQEPAKLPTMAVASALVFAGQMINYTIPGTGSSGHICGGFLLAALLGPRAAFMCMSVILGIQCFFFADGGILALGANIWNMAFYGCFVGYYVFWRPIMRSKLFKNMSIGGRARSKIWLACLIGCVVTLQMGAFSVVIETLISGITELPFGIFVGLMQPIHLAIGAIEGGVTAAVLTFLYQTRPEMLREHLYLTSELGTVQEEHKSRFPFGGAIIVLAISVAAIAGGFSLLASTHPDGLEWAIGNIENAEDKLEEKGGEGPYEAVGVAQEKTSFLPDYAFKNDDENPAGTTISGLVGAGIVAGIVAIVVFLARLGKRKRTTTS